MDKEIRSSFFFPLLLSILLLFSDRTGLLAPPRAFLERLCSPLQFALYSLGKKIKSPLGSLFRLSVLEEENRKLEEELALALSKLAELKRLKKENEVLRKQLGVFQDDNWEMIPALVLGRDRFLKINRGKRGGVREGMVVVRENVFLGRIVKVTDFASLVQLVLDPNFKILARTEKGTKGIVVGSYQSGLLLTKVLTDAPLSSGDLVYARNQEGMPPNLLLGRIKKVFGGESQLFWEAEVEPIFDFSDLEVVFIAFPK